MGRHRAQAVGNQRGRRASKPQDAPPRRRRNPELLGWGLFLTGTTAVCLVWAAVPVGLATGATALLLGAFLITWHLSADGRPVVPAVSPADFPSPVPATATHPAAVLPAPASPSQVSPAATRPSQVSPAADKPAAPAIPAAPGAVQEFLPRARPLPAPPAPASLDGPSRWTRTFGPPETGSLPLQPYVPARRAVVQAAETDGQDRRQRSHSSH